MFNFPIMKLDCHFNWFSLKKLGLADLYNCIKNFIWLAIFFSLIHQTTCSAQNSYFPLNDIKGKIKSVEIFCSTDKGDSDILVMQCQYNNSGTLIYEMEKSFSRECKMKKAFTFKDSVVSYRNSCREMDNFIRNFVLQKNPNVFQKYESSGMGNGGGSGEDQVDVEICRYNKLGKKLTSKNYSNAGLLIQESKFYYDKRGNLVERTYRFLNDTVTYFTTWEYDIHNNNIKRESTDRYSKDKVVEVYTYDKLNRLTSYLQSSLNSIISNYVYFVDSVKNKSDYYSVNLIKQDTIKDKTLNYDDLGKLIEMVSYDRHLHVNERAVFTYFNSGRLSSKQNYDGTNRLIRELIYADDVNGNCIQVNLYQKFTTSSSPNEVPSIRKIVYKRNISYY